MLGARRERGDSSNLKFNLLANIFQALFPSKDLTAPFTLPHSALGLEARVGHVEIRARSWRLRCPPRCRRTSANRVGIAAIAICCWTNA